MKKIFAFLLSAVLIFSVVACGDSVPEEADNETQTATSSTDASLNDETENDIVTLKRGVSRYGGELSKEYLIQVIGFGNPVPLQDPCRDYPEKGDNPLGDHFVSNVSSDHPEVAEFDMEEVKQAIYAWIEWAMNYEPDDLAASEVYISSDCWRKIRFWENDEGEIVLFVELIPKLGEWPGSGLYRFRITKLN